MGILEGPDYYTNRFIDYIKEKKNIKYYIVNVKDRTSYESEEFEVFSNNKNVVMFTFNNVGIKLETKGVNYWKDKNIPVFDYIVDHPRYFEDSMLEPECDLHVFTLDEEHKEYIEKFYPRVKSVMFSPNGGTEVNGNIIKWEDRDIDVLYMGDCKPEYESYPDLEELGDRVEDFYTYTITKLVSTPMISTETAIESTLRDLSIAYDKELLYEFIKYCAPPIEAYVRRYFKLEGMKALDKSGVKVDVYGRGWGDNAFSDNIMLHGRIKRKELMNVIGRTKISLCFIPWFKRGCSEKNFDSMLNGALCVTDKSMYLCRNYTDGYNIVFFDLNNPEQMAMDIKWLLENPQMAKNIAIRGYETAKVNDTWTIRFNGVLKHIYDVCDDNEEYIH